MPVSRSHGFINRLVVRSVIPFDWRVSELASLHQAKINSGILRLFDEEERLHVSAAFEYQLDDGTVAVFEQTDLRQVQSVGEALIQRNLIQEDEHLDRLTQHIGSMLPLALDADAALNFLADHLNSMPPNWRIEGGANLKNFRVVGRLTPRVSVPSGIDWLDLKIEFAAGDQVVDASKVLKAWRSGERFVRLEDDTLVRLPVEWLRTYGVLHEGA